MHRRFSKITSAKYLKKHAGQMGIPQIARFTGQEKKQIKWTNRTLAETLEALIAAIYLHSGYQEAKGFVIDNILQDRFL